jgi:hypothetical protein
MKEVHEVYKVDERRLISGEMLFTRGNVGGMFLDCSRAEEITTELHISQRTEFMKQYKLKEHGNKTEFQKTVLILKYQ